MAGRDEGEKPARLVSPLWLLSSHPDGRHLSGAGAGGAGALPALPQVRRVPQVAGGRLQVLRHPDRPGGGRTLPAAAQSIIDRYDLQPHPEGGWYREVHRSPSSLGLLPGYTGERTALTVIYFLLAGDDFSAFHRVRSEEVWVHLAGDPLELVLLDEEPRLLTLSPPGGDGEPLLVVPPGVLQAARPLGAFTFVTCLVAPGFDFADFELPARAELESLFPHQVELVRRFTRLILS